MAVTNEETNPSLTCQCGSREFHVKVLLRRASAGGTSETPAGYRCRQCDADVDIGSLVRRQELIRKRRELQQMQDEVNAAAAPPKGVSHAPAR